MSLKKEEGDPVLVEEEGWKEGSWVPSLSAFTPLDSFMGRGRMGGEEEVGESYTEGDVFAEEDWGPPIDNSGEKESDDKRGGDKDGDGRRRSKRDSKITPRMAAYKTVRIEMQGTEFGGTFFYNRTDHVFFQSLVEKNEIMYPFSSHGTGAIRWASAAMVYSSACGPSAPVLLDGAR